MSSVASPAGLVHVGMDTSKKTIMIATLWPGEQVPATERIANEEAAIRRFFRPARRLVRAAVLLRGRAGRL